MLASQYVFMTWQENITIVLIIQQAVRCKLHGIPVTKVSQVILGDVFVDCQAFPLSLPRPLFIKMSLVVLVFSFRASGLRVLSFSSQVTLTMKKTFISR